MKQKNSKYYSTRSETKKEKVLSFQEYVKLEEPRYLILHPQINKKQMKTELKKEYSKYNEICQKQCENNSLKTTFTKKKQKPKLIPKSKKQDIIIISSFSNDKNSYKQKETSSSQLSSKQSKSSSTSSRRRKMKLRFSSNKKQKNDKERRLKRQMEQNGLKQEIENMEYNVIQTKQSSFNTKKSEKQKNNIKIISILQNQQSQTEEKQIQKDIQDISINFKNKLTLQSNNPQPPIPAKDFINSSKVVDEINLITISGAPSKQGQIEYDSIKEIKQHIYGIVNDENLDLQIRLYFLVSFYPRENGIQPEDTLCNSKQAGLYFQDLAKNYIIAHKEIFTKDPEYYL